ncbi:DNA polymerase III subunit delta [Gardnerella vaginalis]|uniref:DNA polymerase III subunit delta n=1 Tax=Gardnerella vaginalis TaxID=2702 RepID=UPI000E2145B4|nr:DNA polymerase III subunit delta [Gardnerella vaginalis]RDW95951.1 DNA polymerase III subunit delta [Gardnerella vaginalis]
MQTLKNFAPLTIVVGGDAYLNDLNARDLKTRILGSYPDADVVNLDALNADKYAFVTATGPSLFSSGTIVVINNLEQANEDLVESIIEFCVSKSKSKTNAKSNINDCWVIARHEGGVKRKSIVTKLEKAGANKITVPDLKKDDARLNFVLSLFERQNRTVEPAAAARIVEVLGGKTDQLASLCSQLCFDFEDNPITLKIVDQYLISDPQVTGFFVADKAAQGNTSQAILASRRAILQGVDAIALIGALAAKMRIITKAIAVKNGEISNAQAKVNPWALKMAMRDLGGWNDDGIRKCFKCLAWADEQCKGGTSDADYALEKCISMIACRGR